MASLVTIPRPEAPALAPLFEERTSLRAVVDAVLEGRLGTARADDDARPAAARLDIGCYAIFGGDATSRTARELVGGVRAPCELLFPDSDGWRRLLAEIHGSRLSERPMRAFSTDDLDKKHLLALSVLVARGFEVVPVDSYTAAQLGSELEPHAMQVFDTPTDFAERGIGFCATHEGTLACAATSYTICSGRIELAIATHPNFRRRGLARAVAARLMLECLERDIVPHWSAANPVSQRLAIQLGYRAAELIEIQYFK